jgi:hypothetical protein
MVVLLFYGLNASLCCNADLNSKYLLKIMFIGIYYSLKQKLKLIFKVRDHVYHFWIMFKFNI